MGERYLPGLIWDIDGNPCVLWPQVSVLTPQGFFRIDVLALICDQWKTIELNGKNHDPHVLGHEPIVIDNEAIRNLSFVEPLRAELRKLIPKRRKRDKPAKQQRAS